MGQSGSQPSRRTSRTRVAALVIAWLVLSTTTLALHRAAWRLPPGTLSPSGESILKHASNVAQVLTLPGWIADKAIQCDLPSLPAELIGSFGGWAFWFAAAWYVRSGLRRMRQGRTALTLRKSEAPANPARRAFLTCTAGASAALGLGGVSAMGAVVNPLDLRVARYRIPIRNLPPSLGGLRIVQITDLHLGALMPETVITRAVELALSLKPDLFALTGDYVDRGNTLTPRLPALVKPLVDAAPVGVVGVLGNHDYYGNHRYTSDTLEQAGVTMLDNRRVFLDAATRRLVTRPTGPALCLAGLEDFTEAFPDIDVALAGVPADMPRLVMTHNPDAAEVCIRQQDRVDLLLCGHTHGGQVHLPLVGSMLVPSNYGEKYRIGLVQGPRCPVLVCAGVGLTVLPIRIGVMPELVDLTLVPG